jgi:hypothetical protein
MSRSRSPGRCAYCDRVISKSGMTRHLQSCEKRAAAMKSERGSGRLFHIVVEGRDNPEYWVHLEAPGIATLDELDALLRETWLECCGHLSAFYISGLEYSSFVDPYDIAPLFGPEPETMNKELYRVLRPGTRFFHEYDFGSTTRLTLRVVSERKGRVGDKPIAVLARNEPPEIACSECGRPATQVCVECIWEGRGWLCEECAEDHDCDEYLRLPVVNSPRVGVCSYTGQIEAAR